MLNIVFLDSATFSPETVVRRPNFPHQLIAFERTAPDEVATRIADADIVITNKVKLTAETIAAAPKLALIAVAATGYDCVDVEACRARGIVVSNIRGYAVRTVPEHVFALIFSLRRSLTAYQAAVAAGRWQASGQFCFFDYPIRDLAGSTLGIIGGGRWARRWRASPALLAWRCCSPAARTPRPPKAGWRSTSCWPEAM